MLKCSQSWLFMKVQKTNSALLMGVGVWGRQMRSALSKLYISSIYFAHDRRPQTLLKTVLSQRSFPVSSDRCFPVNFVEFFRTVFFYKACAKIFICPAYNELFNLQYLQLLQPLLQHLSLV